MNAYRPPMHTNRQMWNVAKRYRTVLFASLSFLVFAGVITALGHIEYRHQREEAEASYQYEPAEEAAKRPSPSDGLTTRKIVQGVSAVSRSAKAVNAEPSSAESPDSTDYHPHCDAPPDRDAAALCAQWAAVHSTRVGNGLSVTGLYFAWLGMILSLVVGAFTAIGVFLASRAAELASSAIEAMAKIDRAYLDLSARPRKGLVGINVQNCGNSPASVVFRFAIGLSQKPADMLSAVNSGLVISTGDVIATGKTFRFDLPIDEPWMLVGIGYRDVFDVSRLDWRLFEKNGLVWRASEDGEHDAAYLERRYHGVFPFS